MPPRHSPWSRVLFRALMCLALPVLALTACDADAQRQPSPASARDEDYRLTMPAVRKALSILYAGGAETECAGTNQAMRDVRAMSAAEMEKLMGRCAPVQRAALTEGISLGELARVYKALTLASYRMAEEESAKLSGATAPPLPPGPLRDNVTLLRQNEVELARLAKGSK